MKVHSFTESAAFYQAGDGIRVHLPGGTIQTKIISWAKSHGRGLLMGFEAVSDREHVERLVGSSLFIDKSKLPPLEEDTYYWSDLLGLKVIDCSGLLLGSLEEVIPTPGNDVYVVKGVLNGQSREILIPAVGAVIRSVDLKSKTMVVDPPEGL